MSVDSAIADLRTATGNSHAALEALPAMRRLLARDYSMEEYGRLLQQFRVVYGSIEPLIVPSEECRTIAYAQRLPRIESALQALQVKEALPPNAQRIGMVNLDTSAGRWGCLYVIEGSILGGQVIQRHLQSLWPECSALIPAPFVPYEHPGLQWQKFRENLQNSLVNEVQRQQAIDMALATFEVFRDAFSRIA